MKKQNAPIIQSIKYLPLISQYTFYSTYSKWYHLLQKSRLWSVKQIQKYQNDQLKILLNHAYYHVPYYHKLFKSQNLKPNSIKSTSDLPKIPVLTKEIIKKNKSLLKAINYPKTAFQLKETGGTTGIPLSFYLEKTKWLGIHFAFNKIYMQQAGYKWSDKVVSISGINKALKYHPIYRTLEFSSFHTTSNDFDTYNKYIHKFKPKFITTYPSAILLFTSNIINRGKKIYPNIDAIFLHGEMLPSPQKKFLEENYNCTVFDQYGHREQCVLAATCDKGDLYHVFPEYGFVEILDEKNHLLKSDKRKGEIVGTSLLNHVFPFIRYKTGDLTQKTYETCSCGKKYPLLDQILGRTQEYLIGNNQEKIPLTGLYHLIAEQPYHIKECQLYQDTEGELIIYFVKEANFSYDDEQQMELLFKKKIGKHFSLIFKPVDSIRRTKDGKFKYLIQKIPIQMN